MGFFVTAQQVALMGVFIALGIVTSARGWIRGDAVGGLTNVVVYFVTPCVILQAFNRPFDVAELRGIAGVFVLAILAYPCMIGLAHLVFGRWVRDDAHRVALRFGAIYANTGFLGLPLAQALLGPDGVFYGVASMIAYNLIVWVHGYDMFPDPGHSLPAAGLKRWTSRAKKIILNPNIIAVAGGLVLFIASIDLPEIVVDGIDYLAAMNAPLSMLVLGASLGIFRLRDVVTDRLAWSGTAVRNLVIPLLSIAAISLYALVVPLEPIQRVALLIPLACPVGAFLVMFAVLHRVDTVFPNRLVLLSTLCSIVTIPTMLSVASLLPGW
ncbi:MAG: AEC family transporter [Propionibacteriaceae bacterium]|nr:AEC family transporter [Propionibacteriaceae bacterium]